MDFLSLFMIVIAVMIISGITYEVLKDRNRTKLKLAENNSSSDVRLMLRENAELNKQVLERLDTLDNRVSGIEKTLSEIP